MLELIESRPLLLLVFLSVGGSLLADGPDVQYLHPAGAMIGGEVEVELIGKDRDTIQRLHFSRPGIEAKLLGKGRVSIKVPPDTPSGGCDVWAASDKGLSAPLRIAIDAWPVHAEAEPKSAAAEPQRIVLPAHVAGRIEPGTDSDWYRVNLAAGEGLTLACRSLSLGGTVWPAIVVIDPRGREMAHDTLTRFEPTLHVTAAEAGDYSICVQDRSYRATAAPFYRLTLTTGPWMVAAWPPSLESGKSQTVSLYGYQLPGGQTIGTTHDPLQQISGVSVAAPISGAAVGDLWTFSRALFVEQFAYRHEGVAGHIGFELLNRPTWHSPPENQATAASEDAPLLTLPVEVVGRFSSPRQVVDWYRFAAKKGETFWFSAVSERIDQLCDLEFIVYDAAGKALETFGNVVAAKGQTFPIPLETRDPEGAWKAPASGEYRLAVRDLLAAPQAPVERAYRLSLGPRIEDVRVVAQLDAKSPRGWSVESGEKLKIELNAIRRGGHEGPITIRAEDVPEGLTISPVTIPAKKDTASLVIEAAADAVTAELPLRLIATSEVNRQEAVSDVAVASPVLGSAPPMSRLCHGFVIAILEPAEPEMTSKEKD